MVYRLLAVNIDGTLVQDNGRIHKLTKEAIRYVQNKGIYIGLISSRHYHSVKKIAKSLKADSIIISHQGAFTASQVDKPVFVKRINEEITFDLVRFLESFYCQIRLVHDDFSISNKVKSPDSLIGKTIWQRTSRNFYAQYFVDSLSDHIEKDPVSPPKIEVNFDNTSDLLDAKKAMEGMYDEVDIILTENLKFDIVPRGVSKLNGLINICEKIGIQMNEIVMIGSGVDDIPLIKKAGLGVAMGNAPDEVKRQADWVTRSNQDHGVSYVVKELFRRQQPIRFLQKMNMIDK
ncbi:Cof subfamily protein (haloacid dehalogenase superfamily) [Oikeobacillus pervagus]|uniref:Cof subfamily protein (Haloacid dehalogenase superfamily) n=1 Tax=Oikeobacillus pervagus TaxID=1325931 RepID=A0AAJ1WK46_9BACI|nr:Cof-type HAD-IIB family hydrolase [Oikeobacillus pervagus]MDQ0214741.1 Cof subfamily protein (haloacid dehalogenase superfamily) [Oikeobacillus pervagus]